ncbi:Uma2 family endonuclease [uncultured Pseudacidovorax sp.]|uniref:Uma2 family endonuclease n=1 Tax=uncultured Pseudacidovorax sp. TaxID=679313 RepID=UPI0025D5D5F7|nr:Uma2 family endonuclease [uncultured Pseudacidovorax sp.]
MPSMTEEEYLVWEKSQEGRHEYVEGRVYAVHRVSEPGPVCGDDRHVTAALNLAVALHQHLRDTPCRAYMSDMRLHVASSRAYFYPDVMVTCHPQDRESRLAKSQPVLVAEVLSPSTGSYDHGVKFAHYRTLESLKEYALIDPERRSADVYRKGADGLWVLHPFAAGDTVEFASVELRLPAAELFAKLD